MKSTRIVVLMLALTMGGVAIAQAQTRENPPKAGSFFLEGSVGMTSLLNDTQDPSAFYQHYAFVGGLDWPALGATLGGGVFVAQRLSVGAEVALRRTESGTISEQEYEISGHGQRTSTYTSNERLLSFVLRFHSSPARKIEVAPLGGLTRSWASRALTGRSGNFFPDGRPAIPITAADASLDENKWGIVGGADVALAVGGGAAVVCAPRIHWIDRAAFDPYYHTVPKAARLIFSLGIGLEWRLP